MWKQILQKKKTGTMTQYEKIKVESFTENILQNLRNNIYRLHLPNLPSSNLNMRNLYKQCQLSTTKK